MKLTKIPGIQKNLIKNFLKKKNLKNLIQKNKNNRLFKLNKNINNDIKNNMLNFYNKDYITPFIPVAGKGPWILTNYKSIVYDVGSYGMLSFGHSPQWSLDILKKPHVMANSIAPNYYQYLLTNKLKEIINQEQECPYKKFSFLNSGSESMELALRLANIKNNNKKISEKNKYYIVLKNGFHGRTSNAAYISDSSYKNYNKYLNSYNKRRNIKTVKINDIDNFKLIYHQLLNKGKIVEAVIMEPVMGEGNPGIMLTKHFYNTVRFYTEKYNSFLIIDSVQAGLRTTGYLSIVDYPKLKNTNPPDMEIFSKAISSGQFPLSILAVNKKITNIYKAGLYGNTMTSNPKALEICYETLEKIDKNVINNIQKSGKLFKTMLYELKFKYPNIVDSVTGSGLLLALHINENFNITEKYGLEYICRMNGLNVIHGGKNALRFTPYFLITSEEIELIKSILDDSINYLKNSKK